MSSPTRNPRANRASWARSLRGARIAFLGLPAALVATLAATPASAQTTGFTANRYEPGEAGSDWFENDSLDLRGKVRPAFSLLLDYAKDNVDLLAPDGSVQQRLVADQLFLHLGASLVLIDRVRVGLSLPFALDNYGNGNPPTTVAPPSKAAVGDLRAGLDVRILGEYGEPFQLAVGGQIWAPTGAVSQYTSDGAARGGPHILVAGDIADIAYAARIGLDFRGIGNTVIDGQEFGHEFTMGLAVGGRLLDKKLLLGPEISYSTYLKDAFKSASTPAEALLGAHYTAGDFKIGAGVGVGITNAFGAPDFRALLGLDWIPAIPVKKTGIADRDGDGVPDELDACPDVAGVATNDPKTNGCPMPPPPPPPDTDKDGVYDMDDACPEQAGLKSDNPKTNGCPDRDKDGIFDFEDACPDVPGVRTSDPKTNGCPPPDPDRDHDGIPNETDACPDEPGPANADPKKNGCPLAFVSQGQIKITEQVKFQTGSARILKDSDGLMNAVTKILTDHPEIKLVRVEGHTDNVGQAAYNKTLSSQRAASVVAWLTLHGIDKSRLASEGFGMERPIDSNTTDAGRANNRRVEFHIDKQDGAAPAPAGGAPSTTKPQK